MRLEMETKEKMKNLSREEFCNHLEASKREDPKSFSVSSWNILADRLSYVLRMKGHERVTHFPTEKLHWDYRGKEITKLITSLKTDVMCFQEVEVFNFQDTFKPTLNGLGYEGLLQKDFKYSGLATFYNSERFQLVSFNSRSRATITVLKHKTMEEIPLIAIANVHLMGEYTCTEDRFNQIKSLLLEIQKDLDMPCPSKPKGVIKPEQVAVFMCGDFNCNIDSGIHKLAFEGKLAKGYQDEAGIYNPKADFSHPFLFKDSYLEAGMSPPFTFKGHMNSKNDEVDFILFTPLTLKADRSMEVAPPHKAEEILASCIPNDDVPSDHIQIACTYKFL